MIINQSLLKLNLNTPAVLGLKDHGILSFTSWVGCFGEFGDFIMLTLLSLCLWTLEDKHLMFFLGLWWLDKGINLVVLWL